MFLKKNRWIFSNENSEIFLMETSYKKRNHFLIFFMKNQ